MKMHKISLLAAVATGVLFALTPSLRAEDKPAKAPKAERPEGGPRGGQRMDMLKEMAEKLELTADQKAKLQEAFKAQRENRKDLKDATPEERRAAMKEAREAMDAKIKEILTPEQYAKWEKIRQENRPGGPGGPGGKRPGKEKSE
jgi:Spy/CpxP family protein refolding chaperone